MNITVNQKYTINQIIEIVKNHMNKNDSSHNYDHVERVIKYGNKILKNEWEEWNKSNKLNIITKNECEELVFLCCLLHDMEDHKYKSDNNIDIKNILHNSNININMINRIIYIINNVSYSKQIKNQNFKYENNNFNFQQLQQENILLRFILNIVRDADRLDAIGSFGIARTFIYTGSKNNNMYDKNKPINNNGNTTIQHFYDKLLKLKDMMSTKTGKKMALHRHKIMQLYIENFKNEIFEIYN
jgi:uncharacterized protein